jgi:16S rRNA (cytosine1402-N4)-methyltransferase
MRSFYHQPVMAEECLKGLAIRPDGVFVDATFGGGGHSRLILEALGDNGRLFGFDQDDDARANALDDPRFTFVPHNFRHIGRFLRLYEVTRVDGILADLGVSSHQIDAPERGFSFRFDSRLDMRMNQNLERDAADWLNEESPETLLNIFSTFGEVRNARTLARSLAEWRQQGPFDRVGDLLAVVEPLARGKRERYLAQVFQALRIAVNDEMGALAELLNQSLDLLRPGGRLVVLAYHSVEDRMVKNFLKTGNVEGTVRQDFYGNIFRPFDLVHKKALSPSEAETRDNPRARSAKLRVGARRPEAPNA